MAQMGRPGLSASQKSEVWRRWKSGQSHSDIGRALGKHPASIHVYHRRQWGYRANAASTLSMGSWLGRA